MLDTDLLIGLGTITVVTIAVFTLIARVNWKSRKTLSLAAGLCAALFLVWFSLSGRDSVWLPALLPFSNLVVVGNWVPPAMAVLAGIVWRTSPGNWLRRSVPVAGLAAIACWSLIQPLLGQPPPSRDLWKDDVCLQSSEATCSVARAATLLKAYGITTSEAEMARLCLTRKGTTWLGLYRGLKLKTAGSSLKVVVFDSSIESLRDIHEPVLLDVGLPKSGDYPRIYSEEYGWQPGVLHSVIFYGFKSPDRVLIAEPTPGVGHEEWSLEDLQVLYRGRGFRLMR